MAIGRASADRAVEDPATVVEEAVPRAADANCVGQLGKAGHA